VIEQERKARRASQAAASVLCGLLTADIALIVLTGGLSILTPGSKATGAGFAFREVLLALGLVIRLRLLSFPPRRVSAGQLLLLLAALPSLFHLHQIGRRITGDGLYLYSYTRSLMRDGDVQFANEYEHYGLGDRDDLNTPTPTGHRRSSYAIGPGLLWTPFFAVADLVASGLGPFGVETDRTGYGPLHVNAAALGSFVYGLAALLLMQALLRRHFGDHLAGWAVLLLWWASFLEWYISEQPLTSHAASVFLVAAFLWLRQREGLRSAAGSAALGLLLGLGMSVRWQNGVFLLLPAVDALAHRPGRKAAGPWLLRIAALLGGVLIGALPQMLAWKAIYGHYVLPYPPQGADYLRLGRPYVLNMLFSSRHGLLSWTPVFWLCLAGLAALTRRSPRTFAIYWLPVLLVTYINACVGDWWAGGSFSNRRFDSLLPVFALGLAAFLQIAREAVRRLPSALPAALIVGAIAWNGWTARAVAQGQAPAGVPLDFRSRAFSASRALARQVGFPATWPASWIFAWRHGVTPEVFDLASGKYLFFRQNNLGGIVDLGADEDAASVIDGFSHPMREGAITFRRTDGGRLIVSLDLPVALTATFEARTPASANSQTAVLRVLVNGVAADPMEVTTAWTAARIELPRRLWRRGANVISLSPSGAIDIDRVVFERQP